MQQSQRPFANPFLRAMHELLQGRLNPQTRRRLNALIFALTALSWASCMAPDSATQNSGEFESTVTPLNGISWRYLALGDSYTIGESVASEDRWPNQLQAQLETAMIDNAFEDVAILATTGWTTSNLSQALSNSGYEEEAWDMVSLLIGVNNQYQGASIEQYELEYENLLQRAIAAADGREDRVFVVSIPDYGYTTFGASNQAQISAELETFNATCKAITDSYNVAHFNITDISQHWPEVEGLVAEDGLHPSGLQYEMWVESFYEDVLELLEP